MNRDSPFSHGRRRALQGLAVGWGPLLLLMRPGSAQAQAAAASPGPLPRATAVTLRLVVPFSPGTGMDLIARTLGPRLSDRLERPVIVDNRAGASGNLGTEHAVRAAPDGATLLVTGNTIVMNRSLYPRLPFDPLKDLAPVSLAGWGQLVLVASEGSGIRSTAELLARARRQPGRLNYGSPGSGTPHHMAMELVKSRARVFLTHIPYRGTGPALTDLLGGQIDLMFLPIHVALAHIRTGRLAALAIGSMQPHALLPEVPPLRTQGVGEVDVDMWYGIMAPRGTPADLVDRFNGELRGILASPEVRTAFEAQGMTPASSTPDEFRRLMERDAVRWEQVVRERGITAE